MPARLQEADLSQDLRIAKGPLKGPRLLPLGITGGSSAPLKSALAKPPQLARTEMIK